MRKEIKFKPMCRVVLAPWEVEALQRVTRGGATFSDQNILRIEAGHSRGHVLYDATTGRLFKPSYCPNEEVEAYINNIINYKNKIIAYEENKWIVLHIRSDNYYKLLPTTRGSPPSIEINGIHMHRISGTDPWRDTLAKIKAARVGPGDTVLDTCMGLGYTAIASVLKGAREVYTAEIDENVILLARYNPWSFDLARETIKIFNNNIIELILDFQNEYFTRIIHDPPRFTSHTGELYSLEFYKELYRVLKPGGILFHYTGEPGRKHGSNFPGRISGKLKSIGFRVLRYDKRAQGIVARK